MSNAFECQLLVVITKMIPSHNYPSAVGLNQVICMTSQVITFKSLLSREIAIKQIKLTYASGLSDGSVDVTFTTF